MDIKIVIVSVLLIIIIAISSAFFIPTIEPIEYIHIDSVDTKIDNINESHVDFIFFTEFIRSDIVQNTNLSIRVFDLKRDLLMNYKYLEIPKENGYKMKINFSFEKIMDYRVLFEIEREGDTLSTRSFNLKHLDTLIPDERRLDISFRGVDFKIMDVEENDIEIMSRFFIESKNDYEVDFRLNVIHFESNIMAYEKWKETIILKNATNMIEYEFTVPNNYNYLVKLEAWRDGALIHIFKSHLNLDPVRKIPEGIVEKEIVFEVEEFIGVEEEWAIRPVTAPDMHHVEYVETPGFSLIMGLISIGGVLYWLKKKKN